SSPYLLASPPHDLLSEANRRVEDPRAARIPASLAIACRDGVRDGGLSPGLWVLRADARLDRVGVPGRIVRRWLAVHEAEDHGASSEASASPSDLRSPSGTRSAGGSFEHRATSRRCSERHGSFSASGWWALATRPSARTRWRSSERCCRAPVRSTSTRATPSE